VSKPFHNPFGVLGGLGGPKRDHIEREDTPAAVETNGGRTIARAVVRIERSGRKGKEVTVVEHLDLTAAERDEWLKFLKAALGCGGSIEGESLVLQGDQRKRLAALLSKRGVKKITVA
jgi:translation initiation factor 1